MKRIMVEFPDGVMCGFVNYVYVTKSGISIGTTAIDTETIERGIVACKDTENYKEKDNV